MLTIRRAEESDMLTYFHWANDSGVRANALNKEAIIIENHEKWFMSRINSPEHHLLYVLEQNFKPIAQVRFDLEEANLLIDYSVDKKNRGMGLGTVALEMAMTEALNSKISFKSFIAFVKFTNAGSIKVFEKLGFINVKNESIEGEIYKFFEKEVQ